MIWSLTERVVRERFFEDSEVSEKDDRSSARAVDANLLAVRADPDTVAGVRGATECFSDLPHQDCDDAGSTDISASCSEFDEALPTSQPLDAYIANQEAVAALTRLGDTGSNVALHQYAATFDNTFGETCIRES